MFRNSRLCNRNLTQVVSAFVGVVALGAAFVGTSSGASAQTASSLTIGDAVVVNIDDLRFRADASLSAAVLSVLGDGTEAVITDGPVTADDYTWYALDVDGESGWAAADYLELATESDVLLAGEVVVVTSDGVNVRDAASLDGAIVATVDTGVTATIVSGPESVDGYDWYEVEIDGTTGWVVSDYLASSGSSIPLDAGTIATVNADPDTLTLRVAGGIETDIIGYLPNGSSVTIVSGPTEVDGYQWYEVTTGLGDGWVAGMYLTASAETATSVA